MRHDEVSLFKDRQTAGEFLFFAGRFTLGAVVIGLTPGSVEIGYATAFLTGGELRHLPMARFERGEALDMDLADRLVVVADDGLTPLPHLLCACRAIEAAGPRRFVLLAPWLPLGLAENLGPATRIEVVTLRSDRLPPALPFYEQSDIPSGQKVAWCVQAVAGAGSTREVAWEIASRADLAFSGV